MAADNSIRPPANSFSPLMIFVHLGILLPLSWGKLSVAIALSPLIGFGLASYAAQESVGMLEAAATGADVERGRLLWIHAGLHVAEAQIELEREVVALAENRSQRTEEVAVCARGIPGDFEVSVGGVPNEQRSVADSAPTARSRRDGEFLGECCRGGDEGGKTK